MTAAPTARRSCTCYPTDSETFWLGKRDTFTITIRDTDRDGVVHLLTHGTRTTIHLPPGRDQLTLTTGPLGPVIRAPSRRGTLRRAFRSWWYPGGTP